jgi:hypothetical protein
LIKCISVGLNGCAPNAKASPKIITSQKEHYMSHKNARALNSLLIAKLISYEINNF